MWRYAEGSLRFGLCTWFTLSITGLGLTAAGEQQTAMLRIADDGEPSVIVMLASRAQYSEDNVTRIARSEPIARAVPPLDRLGSPSLGSPNSGPQNGAAADDQANAIVILASRRFATAADTDAARIEAFATAAPASRTALLQLLDDPFAGVAAFGQRWTAQADITIDGGAQAAIIMASQPLPETEPGASASFPTPAGGPIMAARPEAHDDVPAVLACLRPSRGGASAGIGASAAPRPETIVGTASFYDDAQETSSGEQYDPWAFTAAAQIDIRAKFGGVRFGANYQPAYAIVQYEGKKLIVKINDVGPLKPGRLLDLSRAAMAYFGGLDLGLLADVEVTPLPLGHTYTTGPIGETEAVALLGGDKDRDQPALMAMLQ